MEWRMIEVKPLGHSFFRPPAGVTQAGIHGPSAMVKSLSYPMPSTIAGALAGIAYKKGLCVNQLDEARVEDFRDQYTCLTTLLGEDFILRPGLLKAGGKLYGYIGKPTVYPLEELLGPGKTLEDAEKLELPHTTYIGIALNRRDKTVVEGNLYHSDAVDYTAVDASIIVLYKGGSNVDLDTITPLGAETRVSRVVTAREEGPGIEALARLPGDCSTCKMEAILLTPALVKGGLPPRGQVILADHTTAKTVSETLAEATGLRECISSIGIESIPRGELQAEILNTGWSILAGKVREPYLMLPPGTRLHITASSRECVLRIAEHGLGAHSRLGWGTVALKPRVEG